MRRMITAAAAVAVAGTLLLTGCSSDEESKATDTSEKETTEASPTPQEQDEAFASNFLDAHPTALDDAAAESQLVSDSLPYDLYAAADHARTVASIWLDLETYASYQDGPLAASATRV